MTQLELSRRLGATPVTISRWERGISEPQLRFVARLRRMLPDAFRAEAA